MRIAIYARVSTDDKGQDPENQLRQLGQWCAGHEIAHEYVDHESGRKKDRKQFSALFEVALLSSLAKQESRRMSERTRAGMARARAQGKRIGRPTISRKIKDLIAERAAAGETAYRIARDLGIDRHTAAKYVSSSA